LSLPFILDEDSPTSGEH
jgi:hypothetical protein